MVEIAINYAIQTTSLIGARGLLDGERGCAIAYYFVNIMARSVPHMEDSSYLFLASRGQLSRRKDQTVQPSPATEQKPGCGPESVENQQQINSKVVCLSLSLVLILERSQKKSGR